MLHAFSKSVEILNVKIEQDHWNVTFLEGYYVNSSFDTV